MFSSLGELQYMLLALVLSWPRIAIIFWLLPSLTESVLPGKIRTGVTLSLSLIPAPLIYDGLSQHEFNLFIIIGLMAKEVFIGLIIGFLISIPFWMSVAIGYIIDTQRGAFIASLFTPFFRGRVSPVGILLVQALLVIFFSTGVFLIFLKYFYESYTYWPVLSYFPELKPGATTYLLKKFSELMYLSVLLSAPVMILLFFVDLAMGLVNRFVPQLNVFFLSLPIKGVIAIFIMVVYTATLIEYLRQHYIDSFILFAELRKLFS